MDKLLKAGIKTSISVAAGLTAILISNKVTEKVCEIATKKKEEIVEETEEA